MARKTFDMMVQEWEADQRWKEELYERLRTNRLKSLDITTYDNSGSPYGIADLLHGKKNRGQCYMNQVFEAKIYRK